MRKSGGEGEVRRQVRLEAKGMGRRRGQVRVWRREQKVWNERRKKKDKKGGERRW